MIPRLNLVIIVAMNEDILDKKQKVVLAIGAHPDDLEFGCGATMAKWAAEGATVYYLILTDGSKGYEDHLMPNEELTKTRRMEQEAAAKITGVSKVYFFDYVDGELVNNLEVRKDIVKVIRETKPDVVYSMDPTMVYDEDRGFINHPDHRAAAQATMDAVFPFARNSRTFPELIDLGFPVHKVLCVLLNNFKRANYYVDITETIDKKLAALDCHKSQGDDVKNIDDWVKEQASKNGDKLGVKYAEGFVRINLK